MQRAGGVISRLEWIRVASVFAFVFECVFVFVVEVQRGGFISRLDQVWQSCIRALSALHQAWICTAGKHWPIESGAEEDALASVQAV